MLITTVTIVRKKFSEVYGVFWALCTAHLVCFHIYLCFLRPDNVKQMENANWWGVLLKRRD